MDTIKRRSIAKIFGCRSVAFAAILFLATFMLSGSGLAQAKQPELKEILEKSSAEQEAKGKAKEEVKEEQKHEARLGEVKG